MRINRAMRWGSGLVGMLIAAAAGAATLSTSDAGIAIESSVGRYTLEYPVLMDSAQKAVHRLTDRKPSADRKGATLNYEGGCAIDVAVQADGSILYTFANVPADVKNFQARMLVPPSNVSGGTFRFDSKSAQPFPPEKPAKPHLHQGQAQTFTIKNAAGKALTFTTPFTYTYSQLTDDREWG